MAVKIRTCFRLTSLLLLCVALLPQRPASAQPALRIDSVSLSWPGVTLWFAAHCGGARLHGIEESNISISENGVPVSNFKLECPAPTEPCAVSAALVFDASGSMAGAALRAAQRAGKGFVSMMDGTRDEACVLSFDKTVTLRRSMTTDKRSLFEAIDGIGAGGATALWDGAIAAIEHTSAVGVNPCRAVILLADGVDNASSLGLEDAVRLAAAALIRVFCIGLGAEADSAALSELASRSGGVFIKAGDPQELEDVFSRIASLTRRESPDCALRYAGDCIEGGPRLATLRLLGLCGGDALQTAVYTAPPGEGGFRSLRLALTGDTAAAGSEAVVRFEIQDTLHAERMPAAELRFRYDERALRFLGVEPYGGLMDPVVAARLPAPPGVLRLSFGDGRIVSGAGTLFALKFAALETADTLCSEIADVSLRFEDGCLLPVLETGRICVYPCNFTPGLRPSGAVALCPGEVLELRTDSGYAGYEWLRDGVPMPARGHILAVGTRGAYRVRATDAFGCTGESAVTAVSFPDPATLKISSGAEASRAAAGGTVVVPLRIEPPVEADRAVRLDLLIGFDAEMLELLRIDTSGTAGGGWIRGIRAGEGRVELAFSGAPAVPVSSPCALVFGTAARKGNSAVTLLRVSATAEGGCVSAVETSDIPVFIDGYCEPLLTSKSGPSAHVAPNPAGIEASVYCRVPESGHVLLAVYDTHGRRVALLNDAVLPRGASRFPLGMRDAPAGAYLLTLSAGGKTALSTFLFVK